MLVDKDGKKLKVNSIVAAKKPGRKSYTLKGLVIGEDEAGNIKFRDSQGRHRTYRPEDIKRIRLRPVVQKIR